ncbi:MAG TPA: helix-turn-helix transcriptional regulator [Micromonosporaceae bacterium]|nr:helix-turn-helix transcriptional regulator [Micromonosporaceae bacterium]
MTTLIRPAPTRPRAAIGGLLRSWRQTRRVSQLELSSVSGVSSRHLSFIETGRAKPSREMVLRLAAELDVPLRERNALLQAAGFAPEYSETALDAPEMSLVSDAIDTVLRGHLPYPALVLDGRWNLVRGNDAVAVFTAGLPDHLTGPTANTMRITLHPDGLARDLVDHALVRRRFLRRIRRQAAATGDPVIAALADECEGYPHPGDIDDPTEAPPDADIVMPFRLRRGERTLNLFSTIATFGTATDLTVAELSIETFFPADAETASYLTAMAPAAA